jgi:hypothetical protein
MSEHTDFEELEQIPWAALAAKPTDFRNRYMILGVVAMAVLLIAGWLTLHNGDATAAPHPTKDATPAATVTTTVVPPTTVAPAVYSEADLMAIDATGEERLAVMHAEWLVRDYLTVDADPLVAARVDSLLPGMARPETGAYVEWVAPYAVTSDQPGSYRVELVYRLLTETKDGFTRQPAGAIAVDISIDVDGTARLDSQPEPVGVPVLLGLVE